MKKFFLLTLLALVPFSFYSCGDDDENEVTPPSGGKESSIVGTWEMNTEDESYQMIFTDKNFTIDTGYNKIEGTYTTKKGIITLSPVKYYVAATDADYNPIPGKWTEKPLEESMVPTDATLLLLCDSKVLILEYQDGDAQQGFFTDFMMLYKKGATIVASDKDIQGKWYWYYNGMKDVIRGYLELSGNKFDLIIPVWRERYQGTFTYSNGMIKFKVNSFTVREWGENNESPDYLFQDWREQTPEEKKWKEPSFGYSFSRPFIANKDVAYSFFANLPAYFEKQ